MKVALRESGVWRVESGVADAGGESGVAETLRENI